MLKYPALKLALALAASCIAAASPAQDISVKLDGGELKKFMISVFAGVGHTYSELKIKNPKWNDRKITDEMRKDYLQQAYNLTWNKPAETPENFSNLDVAEIGEPIVNANVAVASAYAAEYCNETKAWPKEPLKDINTKLEFGNKLVKGIHDEMGSYSGVAFVAGLVLPTQFRIQTYVNYMPSDINEIKPFRAGYIKWFDESTKPIQKILEAKTFDPAGFPEGYGDPKIAETLRTLPKGMGAYLHKRVNGNLRDMLKL